MTETSTHLSIGEVLGLLQQDFPDVTISKIRFLESQGLIDPERTPSGYRKFYEPDIERLRWILHQQRENFLPLKVIKERLESGGPLTDQPIESTEPAPVAEVVEAVGVGAAPIDSSYQATPSDDASTSHHASAIGSDEDDHVGIEASHVVAEPVEATWQNDPTMEFDFASLTEQSVHDDPADESLDATPVPSGWGAADLDLALAAPASGDSTERIDSDDVDLDLVEIEDDTQSAAEVEAEPEAAEADVVIGTEAEGTVDNVEDATSGSSVTDRLRSGDLVEPEPEPEPEVDDDESAAAGEIDAPAVVEDGGGAEPRRRPAAERYFSADYSEPMEAMAMNVEELASHSSLTVSQIRELEHFGIIVGESVGPDVVYTEESLAVARAAHTFLERGIEPRHLRPFAMAADRELSLYEQLALPVIRKRDPGTRTEADKLITSLYESGSDLRALLVKRGIRNNFGR